MGNVGNTVRVEPRSVHARGQNVHWLQYFGDVTNGRPGPPRNTWPVQLDGTRWNSIARRNTIPSETTTKRIPGAGHGGESGETERERERKCGESRKRWRKNESNDWTFHPRLRPDKPFHRVMRPRFAIRVKRPVMRHSISSYSRAADIYARRGLRSRAVPLPDLRLISRVFREGANSFPRGERLVRGEFAAEFARSARRSRCLNTGITFERFCSLGLSGKLSGEPRSFRSAEFLKKFTSRNTQIRINAYERKGVPSRVCVLLK